MFASQNCLDSHVLEGEFEPVYPASISLPGYDALSPEQLEDLRLRENARKGSPLYPLDWEVHRYDEAHKGYDGICEICGHRSVVLSHCGRALCFPCMRKKASRRSVSLSHAVIRVHEHLRTFNRDHNTNHKVRFLTLTIKTYPGESLKQGEIRLGKSFARLCKSEFWKSRVWGYFPQIETTRTATGWKEIEKAYFPWIWADWVNGGWHVHIHLLAAGAFMPAGQDFAKKGESNLSDEWLKVTGDSMIVKIESCPDAWSDGQFNSSLVKEIAKYEVKPIDDSEKDIKDWDEDLRRELAEWKAGSFRIRWYCHTHQSRKRSKCLDFKPRPGMKLKRPCDGEYRKERSGRRSLIPRGIFRQSIRELKEEKNSLPESEKWNCWNCGIGKTRSKRSWEGEGRGERVNNAQLALQFTQAHETVVDTRIHRPNPLQDMPSGWIPPPPLEDWSPALARGICQVCDKTARTLDEIFDFLDPEQEHAPTVKRTLWGLSNLGLIYHSKSDVYQFTGDSDILFQKPVAGEVLE